MYYEILPDGGKCCRLCLVGQVKLSYIIACCRISPDNLMFLIKNFLLLELYFVFCFLIRDRRVVFGDSKLIAHNKISYSQ